jgi:hypothetical protein
VRDAAARILEHTTLADIAGGLGAESPRSKRGWKKTEAEGTVLPMVIHGNVSRGTNE